MIGWTIHAECGGPAGGVRDKSIDGLGDLLEPRGGSITCNQDGSRYGATFSLDPGREDHRLDTVEEAATLGASIFRALASEAGLPEWPIDRLEALTFAEHDRELEAPLIPELIGVAEVAQLFGVSRQRVSELRHRRGFPTPVAELRAGPVWARPSLTVFLSTWERRPGRPRVHCPPPEDA
jgi:hypothetical protein